MIGFVLEQSAASASDAASTPLAPDLVSGAPFSAGPWFAFVLIALTLWSLPALVRLMRRIDPGEEGARVGWNAGHLGLVVVSILCAKILGGSLLDAAEDDVSFLLSVSALVLGTGALVALVVAYQLGPERLCAIGLRTGRTFSAPVAAIAAYVLCLPGIWSVGLVWVWFLGRLGVTDLEQPLALELAKIAPGERVQAVVIGVLVLPLIEEILFRGFLQGFIAERLGAVPGILATSVLFALLHGPQAFLPIFALSCLLGLVMWHTQRLHAAWIVHALHNGSQFAVMFVLPEFLVRGADAGVVVRWCPGTP